MIPDSAALVVKLFVAGGYDGGSGKEEIVERCFGTFAAGTVDIGHC